MRIKVYPPASGDDSVLDERGFLELPDSSTLRDVYKKLAIPPVRRRIMISTVNYRYVKLSTKLQEGDVVSFISLLGGG